MATLYQSADRDLTYSVYIFLVLLYGADRWNDVSLSLSLDFSTSKYFCRRQMREYAVSCDVCEHKKTSETQRATNFRWSSRTISVLLSRIFRLVTLREAGN